MGRWPLFLIIILLFSGCSFVNMNRTFIDEMDRESDGSFVPGQDFDVVQGDSGQGYRSKREILARTPGYKSRSEDAHLIVELEELENSLSPSEYRRYLKLEKSFKDASEKIYYLKSNAERRQRYAELRGVSKKRFERQRVHSSGENPDINLAVRSGEVVLGMNKFHVEESWGRPFRVDVAGSPRLENERWAFYENGKLKYIYFENGEVVGWNIE